VTRPADVLVSLLHLCDSLFPIVSFGYSDGLESAAAMGALTGAAGLRDWLAVCRDDGFGRCDGPAIVLVREALSRGAWDAIAGVDADVTALRPSSTVRAATRSMGLRLLKTWQAIHPDSPDGQIEQLLAMAQRRTLGPTLPVAFAAVTHAIDAPLDDALAAYAYTRLASAVSAAMRVMAIGQTEAHQLLSRTLAGVPATIDELIARGAPPESFAPAADVAQMTQQYLYARLFRS
jgi:urease accessory protein